MNKFVPFLLLTILSGSITGCSKHNKEAEVAARLETQKAGSIDKEKQKAAEIEKKKRELIVLRAAIERHVYEQVALRGEEALKNSKIIAVVARVKGGEGLRQIYGAAKDGNLRSTVASMFPHSDTPLNQQLDHSGILRFTPEEVRFAESFDIDNLSSEEMGKIYDTQ